MKIAEAQKELKTVNDLEDFQDSFFSDDGAGEMTPDFEIVYRSGEGYTANEAAKQFDKNGNCTNSYMKFSDGYLPYLF